MKTLGNKRSILVFLLPALLVYTVLVFVPIVQSLYYSVIDWNGIGDKAFIGPENYARLFTDRVFLQALGNNLVYILIVVSMQIVIGFIVALLLTYLRKGRSVIQTVYFIPSVITVIAIAQLFRCLYAYEPPGLFNVILTFFGAEPIPFLSDFSTALPAVAMVEGWQYIGIYMLIFYSALIAIPKDIEEAARIDGTSEIQLLLRIKIPHITNVIGLACILSLVGALRGFAVPLNLTRGGPNHRTEILATYMYKKAFTSRQMGYGSAIAVIIVILSLVAIFLITKYTAEEDA